MAPLSCRGSIALLLVTVCLVFMGSALVKPNASQAQSPPEGSGWAASTSGAADGFQRTVTAFQMFEKRGSEIATVLQKLHAETVAVNPGDTAKQQALFLKKLTERYPGSTYDGATGTVTYQKDFLATFNSALNVDSIKELGAVTVSYLLGAGSILLSDGVSSVTAVIDKTDPSRSRFSQAVIPLITDEAERILSIPGYKRITTDSVETSILNDAYQLLSLTNALRMDYFAADVMRYPSLQRKALGIAAKGYIERHPREYQVGAEPAKPEKNIPGSASQGRSIDIVGFFARIVLIGVLAASVFWIVGLVIRRGKLMLMDNVARLYVEKYNSLSPMVIRSLKELGTSLWGKNFLWSKKYHIIKRSDRWLLCDGKIAKGDLPSPAKNRIEVCLRDLNFTLKITRLNGVGVDMAVTCRDFSKMELAERLLEIRSLIATEKPAPETTTPERT